MENCCGGTVAVGKKRASVGAGEVCGAKLGFSVVGLMAAVVDAGTVGCGGRVVWGLLAVGTGRVGTTSVGATPVGLGHFFTSQKSHSNLRPLLKKHQGILSPSGFLQKL